MNYSNLSIIQKIAFKAHVIRGSKSKDGSTRLYTEVSMMRRVTSPAISMRTEWYSKG